MGADGWPHNFPLCTYKLWLGRNAPKPLTREVGIEPPYSRSPYKSSSHWASSAWILIIFILNITHRRCNPARRRLKGLFGPISYMGLLSREAIMQNMSHGLKTGSKLAPTGGSTPGNTKDVDSFERCISAWYRKDDINMATIGREKVSLLLDDRGQKAHREIVPCADNLSNV